MDSLEHFEDMLLKELDLFSLELLKWLEEYNILTVGHLLGVTKGLLKTGFLPDLDLNPDVFDQFQALIPEDLILKYQQSAERHPTGLLINDDKPFSHEDTEETNGG